MAHQYVATPKVRIEADGDWTYTVTAGVDITPPLPVGVLEAYVLPRLEVVLANALNPWVAWKGETAVCLQLTRGRERATFTAVGVDAICGFGFGPSPKMVQTGVSHVESAVRVLCEAVAGLLPEVALEIDAIEAVVQPDIARLTARVDHLSDLSDAYDGLAAYQMELSRVNEQRDHLQALSIQRLEEEAKALRGDLMAMEKRVAEASIRNAQNVLRLAQNGVHDHSERLRALERLPTPARRPSVFTRWLNW